MRRRLFAFFLSACMLFETPISAQAVNLESTAYVNGETAIGTEIITETETGTEIGTVTEMDIESIPESESESVTEANTETVTESGTEAVTEANTESTPESGTETATEINTESTPESESESVTEINTEAVPEIETESITETDIETLTESETETETEAETETVIEEIEPAVSSPDRMVYESAASSSPAYLANMGMNGLSNPTPYTNSTTAWEGVRVRFGKEDSDHFGYNIPSSIQLNGYTYPNIWRVLDVNQGLLLADMPAVESCSYGMAESGKWEESGIYNYLHTTYLNTVFSANDRKAIKDVTILSMEDYKNTAYGFPNSDTKCYVRSNYAQNSAEMHWLRQKETPDYSYLQYDGAFSTLEKDWAGESEADIEDAKKHTYGSSYSALFSPVITLDTTKVLYNRYSSWSGWPDRRAGFFCLNQELSEDDVRLTTLVMKSDETGFAVENLPDSASPASDFNFTVTGIVPDGAYQKIVALLVDQNGSITAGGPVSDSNGNAVVSKGAYHFYVPQNTPTGTYTLYLFEEYDEGVYYNSTSYASNIIEKQINVLGASISEVEVTHQNYGEIKLQFAAENIENERTVYIYRSESENGEYTLQYGGSFDFGYYKEWDWTDTNAALNKCANKTYYYKVVFDESELADAPVATNAGMGYGYPAKEGAFANVYTGIVLLDENGMQINKLTLHAGESKHCKVALLKKDGTTEEITQEMLYSNDESDGRFYFDSFIGEQTEPDNSYIQCYPAVDFDTGWDVILKAKKVTDDCYLSAYEYMNLTGNFEYRVPLTILPAEPGVKYPNLCPENIKIFNNREEFNQAIRDELVKRNPDFTFYIESEPSYEWYPPTVREDSWCLEEVFDFYEEREGMQPYEGDYLFFNKGTANSPTTITLTNELKWEWDAKIFGSSLYTSARFTIPFMTTKAEEDYVNARMQEIVHTPGGELYDYRDASDYAKAKAAYDYVVNHVSYIGSTNLYWHSAYSALYNKKATCQGYALLYMRLCRELGISCKLLMDVTFTADNVDAHAWNLVLVGNKWYHVDTNARVFLAEKVSGSDKLQKIYNTRYRNYYLSNASKTPYGGAKTSTLKAAAAMTDAQLQILDSNMTSTAARMKGTYKVAGNTIKVTGTLKYMEGCTSYLGYDASEAGAANGYFLAVSLTADKASFDENGRVKITLIPGGQSEGKTVVLTTADSSPAGKNVTWITDSTDKNKNNRINFLVKVGADTDTKLNLELDFDTDGDASEYQSKTYAFDFSGLKYEEPAKSYVTVKEEAVYGVETSSPLITGNTDSTIVTAEYEAVAYSSDIQLPENTALVNIPDASGIFGSAGNYAILKAEAAASIKNTAYIKAENITVKAADGDSLPFAYVVEEDKACVYLVVPMTTDTNRTFTVSWGSARTQTITVRAKEGCILQSLSAMAEPPKSLAFNGLKTTMYVGQSQDVSVTINKKYDLDSAQLSFTSSNPEVLSVNRITGAIKALKAGSANITVTAENGADAGTKKVFKSGKITVKEVTAPGSVKVTGLQDKSLSVTWKANTTGQYTEVYVIPYDSKSNEIKTALGTNASQWKKNLEAVISEAGLNSADGWLAGCTDEEKAAALTQMQSTLSIPDSMGTIQAFVVNASVTEISVERLTAEKEYLVYVRNAAKSVVDTLSVTGAAVVKVKTTKTVFASIALQTFASDGTTVVTARQTENGIPLFVVTGDSLAESGAPEKLAYTLLDSGGNSMDDTTTTASAVTFKTSNKNVIKVDSKKRTVSLGGQAGTALLTVTAKDAAKQTKESTAVMIRVIKEPTALAKKTTTLALGQSVSIQDLIGTNIKGSADEILLERIDFEDALEQLNNSGCFTVSYKEGSTTDDNGNHPAADAILTAKGFAADKKGNVKAGNTVIVLFTLKNESGEAISTQNATIKITDMTAPKVTKSTVRDTSAVLAFTPSNGVSECNGATYYYTLELVDNVTKRTMETEKKTETAADETTGGAKQTNETDRCVYTVSYSPDSTDKKPLILCEIEGLSPNKSYSAYITAHYVIPGTDKHYEKKSSARKFTTLKPLMTQGGSLAVTYAGFDELRENPNTDGTLIDYTDEDGILLENNREYLFMAQVSNLVRGLETDKLKWSISSGDKKAATLKPSGSSYELKLTANKVGTFTVTAVSSLTKESVATFKITIYPYQSENGTAGAGGSAQAIPVDMYCEQAFFSKTDGKKKGKL